MYGFGGLKFGHLTFIVLTGILISDLYLDPDVDCQFLNGDQLQGVTWFYEWILKSLEGAEVQEQDARDVLTRSQMICYLRYRDEQEIYHSQTNQEEADQEIKAPDPGHDLGRSVLVGRIGAGAC